MRVQVYDEIYLVTHVEVNDVCVTFHIIDDVYSVFVWEVPKGDFRNHYLDSLLINGYCSIPHGVIFKIKGEH